MCCGPFNLSKDGCGDCLYYLLKINTFIFPPLYLWRCLTRVNSQNQGVCDFFSSVAKFPSTKGALTSRAQVSLSSLAGQQMVLSVSRVLASQISETWYFSGVSNLHFFICESREVCFHMLKRYLYTFF